MCCAETAQRQLQITATVVSPTPLATFSCHSQVLVSYYSASGQPKRCGGPPQPRHHLSQRWHASQLKHAQRSTRDGQPQPRQSSQSSRRRGCRSGRWWWPKPPFNRRCGAEMGVSVSSTPVVSQSALPHLHLTGVRRHPDQAPPSSQTIATTFSPHSPRQIRKQSPPEGAWAGSGGGQPAVNHATDAHHHELSTPATHNGMRSAATAAVNGSQCTVREELCVVVAATAASHRPTSMLREHLSARRSCCQQRHNAPSHTGIVSVDSACRIHLPIRMACARDVVPKATSSICLQLKR